MVRQSVLEPVQPGGVTNASQVTWQRKKSGELRLCVDLKVHINGNVIGKIDLSGAYYQTELDKEAKDIFPINTSQGLFRMCRLPQGLKNSRVDYMKKILL